MSFVDLLASSKSFKEADQGTVQAEIFGSSRRRRSASPLREHAQNDPRSSLPLAFSSPRRIRGASPSRPSPLLGAAALGAPDRVFEGERPDAQTAGSPVRRAYANTHSDEFGCAWNRMRRGGESPAGVQTVGSGATAPWTRNQVSPRRLRLAGDPPAGAPEGTLPGAHSAGSLGGSNSGTNSPAAAAANANATGGSSGPELSPSAGADVRAASPRSPRALLSAAALRPVEGPADDAASRRVPGAAAGGKTQQVNPHRSSDIFGDLRHRRGRRSPGPCQFLGRPRSPAPVTAPAAPPSPMAAAAAAAARMPAAGAVIEAPDPAASAATRPLQPPSFCWSPGPAQPSEDQSPPRPEVVRGRKRVSPSPPRDAGAAAERPSSPALPIEQGSERWPGHGSRRTKAGNRPRDQLQDLGSPVASPSTGTTFFATPSSLPSPASQGAREGGRQASPRPISQLASTEFFKKLETVTPRHSKRSNSPALRMLRWSGPAHEQLAIGVA
eukprot:TRINITY_DN8162_c0_g1_i1.p1 TRINITY_DN8162_c0_g1~~TRINITY_DN8162_c0_g1_i1.p1  ORF type:complete len:498 (+),score=80.80 TRINITY_DN8162_c0_g1_i1:130-1623(+)